MLDEMRVLADSLKYSGECRPRMIDTRHVDHGSEP